LGETIRPDGESPPERYRNAPGGWQGDSRETAARPGWPLPRS